MLPHENSGFFHQAQAASHEGETKALQCHCKQSEYLEVVENLEVGAFFSYWQYQMAKVQREKKKKCSFKNNGEQQKFSKWGHASLRVGLMLV